MSGAPDSSTTPSSGATRLAENGPISDVFRAIALIFFSIPPETSLNESAEEGTMPEAMPLRPTTVRFAEDGMGLVQKAADEVGSTVAQFIREAALIRAAVILRDEEPLEKISEEVRRLARVDEDSTG